MTTRETKLKNLFANVAEAFAWKASQLEPVGLTGYRIVTKNGHTWQYTAPRDAATMDRYLSGLLLASTEFHGSRVDPR